MAKMRSAQFPAAKQKLEVVERDIPQPERNQVRIKVQACGVCHSDSFTGEGVFPGISYPRVPGHEIAGVIDALGADVDDWKVGDRVGVGWFGGKCNKCEACRRGDFITCKNLKVPGIAYDGGYSEYVVVPSDALALIPDDLSPEEAAPLLCAGITTFNALRHSGAIGGDLVAILGIGGLGHLAVQFASKMGFKTIAIARGKEKETLAKQLGASRYIDSQSENVAQELLKLGGAKVILSTVTNSKAVSSVLEGLGTDGKLLIVGAAHEPLEISAMTMIGNRKSIAGWPSGTSIDSQDAMNFSANSKVRSVNEVFPLEKAAEAYERMMSGKATFRVVLKTGL